MNFKELLANYYLGNSSTSKLPEIALQGLKEGYESESLEILAGLSDRDNPHEINHYFELTKNEIDISDEGVRSSVNILLKYYLSRIIAEPHNAFEYMERINWDVYTNKFTYVLIGSNEKYVGEGLGLQHMFTWYRELQDMEDNGKLFYYNDLPKYKQRMKFLEHLVEEAEKVLNNLDDEKLTQA